MSLLETQFRADLRLYLIDLPLMGRYSFLRLLLEDLLPLLHIFFRGGRERVVELIIAFIHHVPISVSLLQSRETFKRCQKADSENSCRFHEE